MSPAGADEGEQPGSHAPPAASEDIHLPEPSYLPIIVAVGVTVALVGILLSVFVFLIGMVIWLAATVVWIRSVRSEISELPLDHG